MSSWLLFAVGIHQMWYALPLVVAISLVYAATRHEYMAPIFQHALRFAAWIVIFMAVVLGVLMAVSYFT